MGLHLEAIAPGDHARGVVASSTSFDNRKTVLLLVTLAVFITARPRDLNVYRLLPFLLPLLLVSIILASRSARGLKTVLIPLPLLATAAYFVTSAAWSQVPEKTIVDSLVIVIIAAMAAVIGSFCSPRELVGGVLTGCLLMLVLSVAVGVALPGYGLMPDGYQAGSLRGITIHRNTLAFILVIGLIATLAFKFHGQHRRMRKAIIGAFFIGGVLWTASSTCLILSVLAVGLAALTALVRRFPASQRGWAFGVGAVVASLAAVFAINRFDQVLSLVNRDPTLTGRTEIWFAVESLIAQKPWLGFGWGAVWRVDSMQDQLNRTAGFSVPHAHSGYLDIQVQLGAVGIALILLLVLLVALRGLADFLTSSSSLTSFPLILAVTLLMYNRVESGFSEPFTMFLIFSTAVVWCRNNAGDVEVGRY